jgi:uncharacterized protein YbjT (DUF2867 family)
MIFLSGREGAVTKKIAVFGASGRIGQAQVRQLLRHGHQPVAVTRNAAMPAILSMRPLK